MAALVKPKRYDWKDSNLALFGSDLERKIKKNSAETEPAWRNAGKKVGLEIWRIVKFKVTDWPREEYGKFYNGDSYIILNTYNPNPSSKELAYDVHFWIGAHSTQDEYGTAAYKTVELDTYLDDKPVQHRECEGHESELFLSYFPRGIMLMEGGAESGFRNVKPETYTPRLFHVQGAGKNVVVSQVPACKSRLDSGDVFILDMGLTIYQWNGTGASMFERNKGMTFLQDLKNERSGKAIQTEVIDEQSCPLTSKHPFYEALTEQDVRQPEMPKPADIEPELFRVSDASGKMQFSPIKKGAIKRKDFDGDDVFVFETKKMCFVWIGKGATANEKKSGFVYAHDHLMKTPDPLRPIVVLNQGQENKEFHTALAA
jgi:gelsolin